MSHDRFEGGLLGLALGDALGAPFEGGPIERFVWRLIGRTRDGELRWTDDTQMSLDLAEGLVAKGDLDPDDVAGRFARSYRWSRGYGPGAARLLKRIAAGMSWQEASRSVFPDGSYGNGGAMRAPVVGLFFGADPARVADAARRSAAITHAHPLAIEGAVMVATATAKAVVSAEPDPESVLATAFATCESAEFGSRAETAVAWLGSSSPPGPKEVRKRLGNGMAAAESCVTAVYLAGRFLEAPFTDLLAFAAACGGDVDTISAMAGAIWGAANGAERLPAEPLSKLEQRDRLVAVAAELFRTRPG